MAGRSIRKLQLLLFSLFFPFPLPFSDISLMSHGDFSLKHLVERRMIEIKDSHAKCLCMIMSHTNKIKNCKNVNLLVNKIE